MFWRQVFSILRILNNAEEFQPVTVAAVIAS